MLFRSRRILKSSVGGMFALLVMAFVWSFFSGLFGPSVSDTNGDVYAGIAPGETAMRRIQGERVWVTRLDGKLKGQLAGLDSQFIKPEAKCALRQEYCLIPAATDRAGIELRYTLAAPAQLASGLPWFGGYVDPGDGAVYDLLGRVYLAADGSDRRHSVDAAAPP